MITPYSLKLSNFEMRRRFALKGFWIFTLPLISMSVQSCGGGTAANSIISPVGSAIPVKEIFTGDTSSSLPGVKTDEFVTGFTYGGSLVKSQASLDVMWVHPVFDRTPKPVVDFGRQTLVVYTTALGPLSRAAILRVSNSQVIISQCRTALAVAAVTVYYVSVKLVDMIFEGTPKFEVQNETNC